MDMRVTSPAGPQLDVTMGCQVPVPVSPSQLVLAYSIFPFVGEMVFLSLV